MKDQYFAYKSSAFPQCFHSVYLVLFAYYFGIMYLSLKPN